MSNEQMALTLEIKNFGKIKYYRLELKPGQTLIHGESGQGKTTIFRAISFALYGDRNAKGKCWVQLVYGGYTIERQKEPSRVRIWTGKKSEKSDKFSEADEAQGKNIMVNGDSTEKLVSPS